MKVARKSILTGNVNTMEVDIDQHTLDRVDNRRINGELIQYIVPQLSADIREFLVNGITPEEAKIFYPDEDNN